MNHTLVSNIITEKISGAAGREILVLNMNLINFRTREFVLNVIVRDTLSGKEERKSFTPTQNSTNIVYFSGASIKLSPSQELHFQLECSMPILGDLHFRFF
jgi:hypothetical protein